MKTVIQSNRSVVVAGLMATLAVAAMGFAGSAQARDNVYWSVGVGTPGAVVNVGNGRPVYQPQPVYVQQRPVYVQPPPVYVQPAPVYYQPRPVFVRPQPVYVAPQPVYYQRPYGYYKHHEGHSSYYRRSEARIENRGYAPVYYQRDGRDDNRHDGRR